MMPLVHAEQGTFLWLVARQGKITASIAAACLGIDPYTSRQEAWRIIQGKEKPDNRFMLYGRMNEHRARQAYEVESGNLVEETGFWLHDKHDWLGASPDGLVEDSSVELWTPETPYRPRSPRGLVEIKCPQTLPTMIPAHHAVQMQVQMACTCRDWCDYFAWTPDGVFLARLMFVEELARIDLLDAFRREFVIPGVCPPRKKRAKKEVDDEEEVQDQE